MKKIKMSASTDKTFEEVCNEYILNCKSRNLRDGTIKHYKESFKSIFRFIPSTTPIDTFNKKTVNNFILAAKENLNTKDITLYTYARDLKTLLYFAMKNDYIEQFKITLMKVDNEPIECYSDNELTELLKKPNLKTSTFTSYKTWVIINFLLSTGIRLNSLINIKIKDLDFDNEIVYIRTTKNRKLLIIPLNDIIVNILHEYLTYRQYQNVDDYLFCNAFGQKLNKSTAYHSIYDYHIQHKIMKTGVHRYRHTFAKRWIINGGNVVTLQKILGHSSLAITQNYINLLTNDLKKDIDNFNILKEFNKKTIKIKNH